MNLIRSLSFLLFISFVCASVYAQDETVIYFAPGLYLPAEPTETNPNPPQALTSLIKDYEASHPGVTIELVEVPESVSTDTWRVTVFQGGNEPHILSNNYIRVWQEAINDWYLPLNDYINQPNPYTPEGTPGHERWQDSIPEVVWNTTLDSSGNQYLVTVDAVAVGIFYNKEILEEVSIPTEFATDTSLWTDWADMLADMETLKTAGYEPMAFTMSTSDPMNYNWIDGVILTSVYRDSLERMFKPGSDWHAMDQEEIACAIQNGVTSAKDPPVF